MTEATTKAHDLKTPHILIIDGKASRHDWRMIASGAAASALVPGPNWRSDTQQQILATCELQRAISEQIDRDGTATVNGRTAAIYPMTMPPDYWADEDRKDYRGDWDNNGGGVEIVGLVIDEPEDGDEWTAKLSALGYESQATTEDAPDHGDDATGPDLSEWRPLPPDGDGWILFSAFQSEDADLIAQWIRPDVWPAA
jgi:hypothetical protein